MTHTEFDIIQDFFAQQKLRRTDVALGIGDDCALVCAPSDCDIAITTDTLVENVHFTLDTSAADIGFKSLAVNLSDLAAMGATPAWFSLALTLPENNNAWLKDFCHGLFTLANQHQIQLIGGDLTRGPLTITITAHGFLPKNKSLKRSTAQVGDLIYVTHTLGDAAAGLTVLQKNLNLPSNIKNDLLQRLHRPQPRVEIGKQLLSLATSAIDISDGLAADLNHLLEKNHLGARINVDALPLSHALRDSFSLEDALHFALTGGDDYELCFTVSRENKKKLRRDCFTCVGEIISTPELILHYKNGEPYQGSPQGYLHF